MDGTNFQDFKSELLKKESVSKHYEALKPKYEIISRIIARRNELCLSQRELARIAKMHQPVICRLESGDQNVTIDTLIKVADALKMDINIKPKVEA